MAWTGRQTERGDGTTRVQVWDEDGELIYDMPADADTVFTGPVQWEDA
ncbi:MAG TPA: hypothetical protein VJ870_04590 [Amycolatopsis sp.]|nr:hypothetical protein [Amycolatopsis sp.]